MVVEFSKVYRGVKKLVKTNWRKRWEESMASVHGVGEVEKEREDWHPTVEVTPENTNCKLPKSRKCPLQYQITVKQYV